MLYQQAGALTDSATWAGRYIDGDRVNSEIYTDPLVRTNPRP